MSADGLGQKALTNNFAYERSPVWSPDGQRIAFASNQTSSGNDEIFVMNADGTERKKLIAAERMAEDFLPAWSPDGTKIAFTSSSRGRWHLFVANADGGGVTSLINSAQVLSFADWSPDGSRIAFNTGWESDHGDIFVINADGSGETRLTDDPRSDFDPAWSPDGSRIAFISDRLRGPGPEVFLMNADGSGEASLRKHAYGWTPTWSPDGTKIAYATGARVGGGNSQIVVLNADGSGRINLSQNSSSSSPDDISPDWHAALIRQRCVVPRVLGQTLLSAGVEIRSASCVVGRVRRARSTIRRGRIIGQAPRPGVRRSHAARVNLIVSRGPR